MEATRDDVENLNKLIDEIIRENVEAVEEVQSEPQPAEEINVEKGNLPEEDEQLEKEATKEEKDFVSKKAQELWNKLMFDKEFLCERGFGKLISSFSEVIEKRGWVFFCEPQGARIFSSRQGVLHKHGGNEGGFSLCERCLGALRG